MKKGKIYSASEVVDNDDSAKTMIRIEMEDLELAKAEREGRGDRRSCSAWRVLGGM